jgi:prepilin-type N-terminal cleavage/methylation domain-containing protein
MKSLKKIINSLGMSLIEILVAMGVLGILSLIIVNLNSNMNKMMIGAEDQQDTLMLHQRIFTIFSEQKSCTHTLAQYASDINNVLTTGAEFTFPATAKLYRILPDDSIVESGNIGMESGKNVTLDSIVARKLANSELNFTFGYKREGRGTSMREIFRSIPLLMRQTAVPGTWECVTPMVAGVGGTSGGDNGDLNLSCAEGEIIAKVTNGVAECESIESLLRKNYYSLGYRNGTDTFYDIPATTVNLPAISLTGGCRSQLTGGGGVAVADGLEVDASAKTVNLKCSNKEFLLKSGERIVPRASSSDPIILVSLDYLKSATIYCPMGHMVNGISYGGPLSPNDPAIISCTPVMTYNSILGPPNLPEFNSLTRTTHSVEKIVNPMSGATTLRCPEGKVLVGLELAPSKMLISIFCGELRAYLF